MLQKETTNDVIKSGQKSAKYVFSSKCNRSLRIRLRSMCIDKPLYPNPLKSKENWN